MEAVWFGMPEDIEMSTVREKCVSSDYNSLFLPENQGVY
jgi:hypothetical protein